MYSLEVVLSAVKEGLKNRGFSYPNAGERSKDAVAARLLAFDAIYTLTGGSVTGIATMLGSSSASGKSFKDRCDTLYRTPIDRAAWIEDVRSRIAID